MRLGWLDANSDDVDAYLQRFWNFTPFTALANVTGAPAISLPVHWSDQGLPIGVMFMAAYGEEAKLIRVASALEAMIRWNERHPPVSAWNRRSA